MLSPFLTCLTEELTKRGYGDKRQAEIVDRFQGLRESYVAQGSPDPDTLAMARVLAETELATREKNRRAYDTLLKKSAINMHFETFDYNTAIVGATNKNASPAAAAMALLTPDGRSKSGLNVEQMAASYRDQLNAAMGDVIEVMGKGVFGLQKGKAYMENVVHEIFGKATGDDVAKQLATAWNKTAGMVVDLWNHAGGTMRRLDNWGLPQLQSQGKIIKNGGAEGAQWAADHMNWLDWDRMRWPNGAPIKPEDRAGVLKEVWRTLSSDGQSKIDPNKFGGNGSALGNAVDEHRFLIFKDGQAWLDMHAKYGDGNVYEVMTSYIDNMSHKMGLLRVFGSNPEAMIKTVKAFALKRGEAISARMGQQTSAELLKFDTLAEFQLRSNAMNPESVTANAVIGTGNVLTAAQLGTAALAAMPGDFASSMIMRALNGLPFLTGTIDYFRLLKPAEMQRFALQSGFMIDEMVHNIYTKSRFSGLAEYGPAVTKRIADVTMRATMMNAHTNAARSVSIKEMMSALGSVKDAEFDKLPFKPMMERYSITPADWDKMRGVDLWEWREGVSLMRPSSILNSKVGGAQDIYMKFQNMMWQESRYMVPTSTSEAAITLKGNLRPDSLPGALLHSFAMYKNFPVSLALMYGRVAMATPNRNSRLGFIAGMGTSLVLAGAVGLQLREMSKGRDPLPMDTPAFWGKAALASGGMALWGDFLFSGINKQGQGPTEMAAGPIVGFAGDATQLAFGSMFKFADEMGTLKADKNDKSAPWLAKATEFGSRYTPGSSVWWARTALQRELFDPLRAMSDPRGAMKMDRKERQRVKDFGNESWWGPGQPLPSRLPEYRGTP